MNFNKVNNSCLKGSSLDYKFYFATCDILTWGNESWELNIEEKMALETNQYFLSLSNVENR